MSEAVTTPRLHLVVFETTLRLVGWGPRNIDIDLASGRVVVELHRDDGRWVLLSADSLGRVCMERHQRRVALGRHSSRLGRIPLSPQVEDVFLGRQRFNGFRSGLRSLCAYVAQNPAPGKPELPPNAVRTALAPLLNGRALLTATSAPSAE